MGAGIANGDRVTQKRSGSDDGSSPCPQGENQALNGVAFYLVHRLVFRLDAAAEFVGLTLYNLKKNNDKGRFRSMRFSPRQAPRTWLDAVERFRRDGASWKSTRTIELELQIFTWYSPRLDALLLQDIDADTIEWILDELADPPRKPSTVNRYLNVLRAVLNAAVVWRWLAHAPRVPQLRDRARRVRWLTYQEARQLLWQLPPHLSDMAAFSLETGLRRSNVTGLKWSQIDLEARMAWIHADQAKARKAIPLPLSMTAIGILKRWLHVHREYVFTYRGRPVKQTNTKAWRQALDRARIRNFRWHDLRHTWASWHAQNGTPRFILQELGGWSDERMVKNYAHLDVTHLQPYVDQLHDRLRQRSSPAGRRRKTPEACD